MVDTADDLVQGMRDMRIRNAILVTALRRIVDPLYLTHAEVYDAASFDVHVRQVNGVLVVSLKDAPK